MTTNYFTFGQDHARAVGGMTFDKDIVVSITAEDEDECRKIMFDNFECKWAFQYSKQPDMDWFPRGIVSLNQVLNL